MCKTLLMRGLTPSAIRPTKCLQGQKLSICNIIFILLLHRNGGERSSVGYSQGPGQPSGHPGGSSGHPGGNSGHPPPVNYPSHFPNSPHNQVSIKVIETESMEMKTMIKSNKSCPQSQHSLNQSMEKGGDTKLSPPSATLSPGLPLDFTAIREVKRKKYTRKTQRKREKEREHEREKNSDIETKRDRDK